MGIKGLYGFCLKNIKDSHREVDMMEEIHNFIR